MKTTFLFLSIFSIAFYACGSKDEAKGKAGDKGSQTSKPADDDPYAVIDFQALKRTVIKEVVDGIAFTVEIPEHRLYKKEIRKGNGAFPGSVSWSMGFRDGPGFYMQSIQPVHFPAQAESLKNVPLGRGQSVTLVETLPDGGLLQVVDEDTKKYYKITVYRKNAAGKSGSFSVNERRVDPIPGYDAEKAWAVTVAKSFTLL